MKRLFGVLALILMMMGCKDGGKDSDVEDAGGEEMEEQKGAYESGEYPNYFVAAGIDADEVEEKIEAVWAQYKSENVEQKALYFDAGENDNGKLAYIKDVANSDIRSEGMSYGMMFAVQLDDQEAFDALWNFSMTYMWHGDEGHPYYQYFAWHVNDDGSVISDTPAPDGEEYFAMSLYFAAGRWGSGDGIYDYKAHADTLVSAMKNRENIRGTYQKDGSSGMTEGTSLFNTDTYMVRFSPDLRYQRGEFGDHTDPSYHLPAFYELWARFGPEEDKEFWLKAAEVSRQYFQDAAHPDTALTPDYADFEGNPVAGYDGTHDSFAYDAQRTVMNWSVDWAWWQADERERELSDKLQAFFADKGSSYMALYELDGTPKRSNNHFSTGLVAMNAVSALSATDEALSAEYVEKLWKLSIPAGEYRYYDGMLYLFAMLHVSGNFKIYEP